MATKVVVAFGPSDVYCDLSLGGQCGDGLWSEPSSLVVFFGGNLQCNQSKRVVGSTGVHMDVPALLPLLCSLLWLRKSPINLLELSLDWWQGRLVSQPMVATPVSRNAESLA